jgi:hypothetical protein
MAPAPGSGTDDRPGAVVVRRAPMALVTWAFVVLVLVIVAVLLVVKVTRATTSVVPPPVASAPPGVVTAATSVPASAFDTVGAPAPDGPGPVPLSGQPPLTIAGHPAVVFIGAEFCPYCAAERWALVVALGRFGTFSRLGATYSSAFEVFPRTPTFSFDGAVYHSRYVSFSAVEEYGQALTATAPAGFPPLHSLAPWQKALLRRYDDPGTPAGGSGNGTGADGAATLPFVDLGNRTVVVGAAIGFSPAALDGSSMTQIASDLSDPTNPVALAVLGAANILTAALCTITDGQPTSVCTSSGVRAGAAQLRAA